MDQLAGLMGALAGAGGGGLDNVNFSFELTDPVTGEKKKTKVDSSKMNACPIAIRFWDLSGQVV